MKFINFFYLFKKQPILRIIVLISCIIGSLYGFYYYEGQLMASPVYLWVFIPDSPFFTFMYVIVLALYQFGRRYNLLDIFTFIGLTKVGIWTILVLFLNFDYYFSPETRDFRMVIIALHIGMILVAFTLLSEMTKASKRFYSLIILYFIIFDIFDYILGTHPIIPEEHINIVAYMTYSLSILVPAATFLYLELISKQFSSGNADNRLR